MKLILIINLLFITAVGAVTYSQESSFTLNLVDVTVKDVIKNIEANSGFRFFYNDELSDISRKVSVNFNDAPLDNILSELFNNTGITYKFLENNLIVITPESTLQQITVTGMVTDGETGEPLPGVNILVEGTLTGTVTNINGEYKIDLASSSSVLIFSYVGYLTQRIPVSGQTVINVILQPEIQKLEEVVVVGYGTQKVKDLTSSVFTVKSEDIIKSPSGQAMQALQGKVSGLQVISKGSPGVSPTIRVRGIGSYPVKDKDNEAPLYIVDGMFFDNIDFLNTSDITSITVLKDASAAAIYGVRAANGVVLIETKSGAYNKKTEVIYEGYYGTQIAQNVLKMANAEQFTTMAIESGSAADASYILNAMQLYGRSRINPNVPNVNTDWYNEIIRPAAIQNHSLDASGGTQNFSYSIGANYFAQEGILKMKNEYERFNLRSKIDCKVTNWLTVGGNMILSNANRYGEEAGAWNLAYFAVPILPVYDENNVDAFPTKYASAQDMGYRDGQNPFPYLDNYDHRNKIRKMLTNFYAKIDIIPNKLSFKTTYNHSFTSLDVRDVILPWFLSNGYQVVYSSVVKKTESYSNQIWDNVLTFTNDFDKHHLTLMAGTSFRDEAYNLLEAKGEGFPTEDEQSWYIDQAGSIPVDAVKDDGRKQYGLSYFGRFSYNYNNRYLVYGTMRADGSSKYQQKWGYFPTVGLGWIISEESFLKNVGAINYLKLRASWGRLGNDKIQASDGAIVTSVINTAINDVLVSGTKTSSTFSSLKWEVTEEINVGLTASLLNDHLSLDADYYIRDTKNAAINVNIPAIGGSVLKNVGIIRNSGFELSLDWSNRILGKVDYNIGANISTLKNEVRELYGQPYIDGGMAEFRQRSIVGEPLLAFYGREVTGVYQTEAEIQADPVAVANGLVPGDFKYKDQNNDGVIDDDDRVVLGSYFPTFMYGVNFGISYMNIELTTSLMGQAGNKILNRKRGQLIWTNDGNLDADLAKNRWHGEGTSDKYPSSAGLRKGWNQKMSNYFVENGSFFRIQNVQLAYTIKGKQISGVKVPETRISLTAERPLTFFKYNGFSPEVDDGIDMQTYPIPAVYTVGLSVKF